MSDKIVSLADARNEAKKATPARERLTALFDPNTFVEVGALVKNGCDGASVITGYGLVEGSPVYAFSQDITVKSGAVGEAHGSKIKKIYELALKTGAPMVGIFDSNGAAIDEGLDAMNAYGDLLCWTNNLSGVVPQVSLVLGVCAGSAAMIAASADIVVMSEKGEFFLNTGDADKSSAAEAAKAGVAHIVEKDEQSAITAARNILSMLPVNNLSMAPMREFAPVPGGENTLAAAAADLADADLFAAAKCAMDEDSVVELQKDFAPDAKVAFATLNGITVGLVVASVTGTLDQNGCSKIARFATICDSFQIPLVTFINCAKFASGCSHGFRGGVREVAKLAHVYAEATTAKVAVVAGKAFGSAFVALAGRGANADFSVAWPCAVMGALSPETAVAFMEGGKITAGKTRAQVEAEYAATQASPLAAAGKGNIDDVIEASETRATLLSALEMLSSKRVSRLPKKHGNIPM